MRCRQPLCSPVQAAMLIPTSYVLSCRQILTRCLRLPAAKHRCQCRALGGDNLDLCFFSRLVIIVMPLYRPVKTLKEERNPLTAVLFTFRVEITHSTKSGHSRVPSLIG